MFNPAKKHLDELYQFDPASYIDMARKVVAEHEKVQESVEVILSKAQPMNSQNVKDLYAKLTINRIL